MEQDYRVTERPHANNNSITLEIRLWNDDDDDGKSIPSTQVQYEETDKPAPVSRFLTVPTGSIPVLWLVGTGPVRSRVDKASEPTVEKCTLETKSNVVSRNHCYLRFFNDGKVEVKDDSSTNGTFIKSLPTGGGVTSWSAIPSRQWLTLPSGTDPSMPLEISLGNPAPEAASAPPSAPSLNQKSSSSSSSTNSAQVDGEVSARAMKRRRRRARDADAKQHGNMPPASAKNSSPLLAQLGEDMEKLRSGAITSKQWNNNIRQHFEKERQREQQSKRKVSIRRGSQKQSEARHRNNQRHQNGGGGGNGRREQPPPRRQPTLCRFISTKSGCRNGNNCKFFHGNGNSRAPNVQQGRSRVNMGKRDRRDHRGNGNGKRQRSNGGKSDRGNPNGGRKRRRH